MNLIEKGEIGFARLLIPLALGICSANLLTPSVNLLQVTASSCIGLVLVLWLLVYFYKSLKIYNKRWSAGLLVHLFVCGAGVAITLSQDLRIYESHFSRFKNEALVVSVNSEPKFKNSTLRFEGKITSGFLAGRVRPETGLLLVAIRTDNRRMLKYGDEILIPAKIHDTEPPYNPYEFDYKAYLANHQIYQQTFINDSQVVNLNSNTGNRLLSYALQLRAAMVSKIEKHVHNPESAAVLSTLILGYKADLSQEVLSAYSKTGTMHVLSVSGMHVNIVFILLSSLLWFMGKTKHLRLLRAAIIICLIWFYAMVTGFSPSVCRAALMLSVYVLGKALYRSSNSYNLVAASAVLLLIYNPAFLFDAGFQLSYLAVVGLIYFYPKIYGLIYLRNKWVDKVWSYTALSCAAQLATFPLAMFYFHQFPVYFLLSNLFIVIPVTVIMFVGLAYLFIPFDSCLKFIGLILDKSVSMTNQGLFSLEKLPFANFTYYDNHKLFFLAIYVLIFGFTLSIQIKSKRLLYSMAFLMLFTVVFSSFKLIEKRNVSAVTFYSLRKNTAFSFVHDGREDVYTNLDSTDNNLTFSLQAAINSQSNDVHFHKIDSKDGFYAFNQWKLLVWDKRMDGRNFSRQISVDAVLLSGRPKVKINDLLKAVRFKKLFIDGTNSDYLINRWKEEAEQRSVDIYVLKRNPAYTIAF